MDGNTKLIRQSMSSIGKGSFLNTNVNEKVDIFNSTILNILSNFNPHEFVLCDDNDQPHFNKKTRVLIQKKCCI